MLACFADDAEVHDFDDVRIGAVAIVQWWHGLVSACGYTVEMLSGNDSLGTDRFVAFTRLIGEFPSAQSSWWTGSPCVTG